MTIDITIAIAIIGCCLGLAAFVDGRRKGAILEGKQSEQVRGLRDKITTLEASLTALRSCYTATEADISAIKTDLEWLKKAVERIESRLTDALSREDGR